MLSYVMNTVVVQYGHPPQMRSPITFAGCGPSAHLTSLRFFSSGLYLYLSNLFCWFIVQIEAAIQPLLDVYFPPLSGVAVVAELGSYYVSSSFTLAVNIIGKQVLHRRPGQSLRMSAGSAFFCLSRRSLLILA